MFGFLTMERPDSTQPEWAYELWAWDAQSATDRHMIKVFRMWSKNARVA